MPAAWGGGGEVGTRGAAPADAGRVATSPKSRGELCAVRFALGYLHKWVIRQVQGTPCENLRNDLYIGRKSLDPDSTSSGDNGEIPPSGNDLYSTKVISILLSEKYWETWPSCRPNGSASDGKFRRREFPTSCVQICVVTRSEAQ